MALERPFGNLSFREYTFTTNTEKLCIALEAALRVKGYPQKKSALGTLLKLKTLLGKDSERYSFKPVLTSSLIPKVDVPKVVLPDECSDQLAWIATSILGIAVKRKNVQTVGQHFFVVLKLAGPESQLSFPPGTERRLVMEATKLFPKLKSLSVDPIKVVASDKTDNCAVKVRFIYKVVP